MDNDELINRLLEEFDDLHDDMEFNDAAEMVLVTYVFIEGFRKNSNLLWVPNESCIYYKNVYSEELEAVAYTCYDKCCCGRIFVRNDGTAVKYSTNFHSTDHGSMYNTYRSMGLVNAMKERCRTAPASITVRDIIYIMTPFLSKLNDVCNIDIT